MALSNVAIQSSVLKVSVVGAVRNLQHFRAVTTGPYSKSVEQEATHEGGPARSVDAPQDPDSRSTGGKTVTDNPADVIQHGSGNTAGIFDAERFEGTPTVRSQERSTTPYDVIDDKINRANVAGYDPKVLEEGHSSPLGGAAHTVADTMKKTAAGVMEAARHATSGDIESAKHDVQAAAEHIREGASQASESRPNLAKGAKDTVRNVVNSAAGAVERAYENTVGDQTNK